MSRAAVAAVLLAAAVRPARGATRRPPTAPLRRAPRARAASGASTPTPTSTPTLTPSSTPTASPLAGARSSIPRSFLQTHDHPPASGAAFDARGVAALWAGVTADDPEKAMAFFFPLGAYQQVKDVSDPASDWKRRLVAAYARDVHALRARLGDQASRATLVGLEVPDAHARWVDPGEEYNKIGYFRVFSSRLRYTVDGEARSFEVKSLISWRGEWYVVHLGAIK